MIAPNTYINFKGEIENLTYKEIKRRTGKNNISWSEQNGQCMKKTLTQLKI